MMTEAHHLSSIIIKEKFKRLLKRFLKRQGRRTCDIPPKMLTALGKFGIKDITKLLNIIHDTGEIPTDLKKSVYIAIPPQKQAQLNVISTAQ